MSNILYHITATDADGNNKDLYVTAATPAQAYQLWEAYYYEDAAEWRAEGYEPHDYTGELLLPRTCEEGDFYTSTDLRVWEMPAPASEGKPMLWHEDVKVAAWKKEQSWDRTQKAEDASNA